MDDEISKITFPMRADLVPGRVLEQCVEMHAMLATMLSIQIDLFAHITGLDPDVVRQERLEMLKGFVFEFGRNVETSNIEQPPPETL